MPFTYQTDPKQLAAARRLVDAADALKTAIDRYNAVRVECGLPPMGQVPAGRPAKRLLRRLVPRP